MKILQTSSSLLLFEVTVLLVILALFNNNYILATALSSLKHDTSIIEEKQEEPSTTTKYFTLLAQERIIQISPDNELHPGGIFYKAMTFNGSIPAPAISVNQGDTFEITLENKDTIAHSLNLHGIEGQNQSLLAYVEPGDIKTLRATANNVGVFMYHCTGDNLNGIWEHIASGMYGAIIVHPKNEKPAMCDLGKLVVTAHHQLLY